MVFYDELKRMKDYSDSFDKASEIMEINREQHQINFLCRIGDIRQLDHFLTHLSQKYYQEILMSNKVYSLQYSYNPLINKAGRLWEFLDDLKMHKIMECYNKIVHS